MGKLLDTGSVQFSIESAAIELAAVRKNVSMELLALDKLSLKDIVQKFLPSVSRNFHGLIGFVDSKEQPIKLTKGYKDLEKILNNYTYVQLSRMVVYKPEGLKSKYLDYVNTLATAVDYALLTPAKLNDLTTLLATVINNTAPVANIKANMSKYKLYEDERERVNKAVGSHFQLNSRDSRGAYSTVVERNADWQPILSTATIMMDKMNSVDRRLINKKVKDASELIDTLMRMIKDDRIKGLTEEAVTELAEGAYQVARELESFAVTYHRVSEFINLIPDTIEALIYFTRGVSTESGSLESFSLDRDNVFDAIAKAAARSKDLRISGPNSEAEVNAVEKELGFTFSPEYREYLTKLGAVSFGSVEWYGLRAGGGRKSHLDVAKATLSEIKFNRFFPDNAVLLESYGDGHRFVVYIMHKGVYVYNNQLRSMLNIELVNNNFKEYISSALSYA